MARMSAELTAPPETAHIPGPRVVLVIGSLLAGGAERVMADMANYWNSKGWDITLATWSGPEVSDFYQVHSGVCRAWLDVYSPNTSILAKLRSNVLRIRRLRRLLRELKPSAVVSFIDTSNMLTIVAALGLNMRVVVSERIHAAHYRGVTWPWRTLRKFLYKHADVVVAQTHDAARWLEITCKARVRVIPNPLRSLPPITNERELLILAVGRLHRQKGFDLLLRAFARICGDFADWKVVILGAGPELSALTEAVDELHLTGRIEFKQPVKDIESWMSRAGLIVQPSRFEGFPNVVLEAMGMGAAVISAACPSGPAELIQDGINGRLVPVEDVDALAKSMEELMNQPATRYRLGQEAMKVREDYHQKKLMAEWEKCILSCC